jgi:hypothetical protein
MSQEIENDVSVLHSLLERLERLAPGEWWLRDSVCKEIRTVLNPGGKPSEKEMRFLRNTIGRALLEDPEFLKSALGQTVLRFCNQ